VRATPAHRCGLGVRMLGEGDPAPSFSGIPVTNPSGEAGTVSSDDIAPLSVLLFYPRDMTSGCTCVANDMTAMLPEVEAAGAKVFGISPDSIASHNQFIAKEGLGFPLIADTDGVVTTAYGAWKSHPTFGQVINRSSFIVKDGKVVKEFRGVSSGGHADDVVAALKAL
jgi:thioredoxin-dependent peroxiredoxin